jgi:hypothetical protein
MSRAKAMSDEDPMLLAKRVLAVPREHGDAVIHAGLHGHTMRRTLETWIEAHRLAVGSGNLAANEAAEGEANRVEAGFMRELAAGAVRLFEEQARRRSKRDSANGEGGD